jgi:hypothetical protein
VENAEYKLTELLRRNSLRFEFSSAANETDNLIFVFYIIRNPKGASTVCFILAAACSRKNAMQACGH